MKKVVLVAFFASLFCFWGCSDLHVKRSLPIDEAHAQLSIPDDMDSTKIQDVVLACKVWGFAKYHHPVFASKRKNADSEFFSLLNSVVNAPSTQRNDILATWLESLGEVSQDKLDTSKYVVVNNFQWIDDNLLLGERLSRDLNHIKWALRDKNRYVKQTRNELKFKEEEYNNLREYDPGYRLLAIAKFWNIVDSYSPNRNITDKDWNGVLNEYVTKAFDYSLSNEAIISELIGELHDTHATTNYLSMRGNRIVPIVAKFADKRMIVTDTCTLVPNQLQKGDEIMTIAGVAPYNRVADVACFTSHSNLASLNRDASYMSLYASALMVPVVYKRDGKMYTFEMSTLAMTDFVDRIYGNLYPTNLPNVYELNKTTACINIGSLKDQDGKKIFEFIKKYPHLIFDMRSYPADYNVLFSFFAEHFFNKSCTPAFTLMPQALQPGLFKKVAAPIRNTMNPEQLYDGDVAIVVNGQTQSMAEYFTMFLQTIPGVITVGSCTAGADGDVSSISLPYVETCISGLGVYYGTGENAQRNGVKIDYVVEPTANNLIQGEDVVLNRAVALLDSLK